MIKRFCLYSFLLRQEYFAPFIVLAFLEKGLSYTQIGMLLAIREITVALMEIPSGAIADGIGRRKTLVTSFLGYIVSFLIFGLASNFMMLIPAMLCFAVGEAFRTGTHKAMMFEWLSLEGRKDEKTTIYGITRSWGKMGGAICVIPATLLVFFTNSYSWIFFLSIIPYLINCLNVATYPKALDGEHGEHRSVKGIIGLLKEAFVEVLTRQELRRIVTETMCYEGLFKIGKDFLQPIIKTMVLTLPVLMMWKNEKRMAVMVGIVYFTLNMLSSVASRKSGAFVKKAGSEAKAAGWLWWLELSVFSGALLAVCLGLELIMVILFIILLVAQNLWKPVQVARCAEETDKKKMATVLSIQSQVKSLFLAVTAPIIGYSIDMLGTLNPQYKFLPLAMLGVVVSAVMILSSQQTIRSLLILLRIHKSPTVE